MNRVIHARPTQFFPQHKRNHAHVLNNLEKGRFVNFPLSIIVCIPGSVISLAQKTRHGNLPHILQCFQCFRREGRQGSPEAQAGQETSAPVRQ